MSSKTGIYLPSGFLVLCVILSLTSCTKEAGTGGSASLYGKVLVRDYNATFTILNEEYYGQDIDVYLIYGDDRAYSEHVSTNYDGSYEFRYLRPGDYHVFCYSEDTTLQTNALIPIIRDVTIENKHNHIEIPLITIAR